jgi:hypothetical protein
VVERLRSALSVNDVMRCLLVLSRVPYEEMVLSDGFAAVVHVMIKYEDVPEIQRRCCSFSGILNHQEGVSHYDVMVAIAKAGGKPAILEAMKKHPYDTKLQGSACNALVGLALLRTDDNRCDVHVASAIIGTMLRHKEDLSVQESGCGALANLAAGHPQNKKELVVVGAARVVVGVARVVAAASETFWGWSAELHDKARRFFSVCLEEISTEVDNLGSVC